MKNWIAAATLFCLTGLSHATPILGNGEPSEQGMVKAGAPVPPLANYELHSTEVVMSAMSKLDIPYRLGGNSKESGFDCSGLVHAVFKQTLGLVLPRRAAEQAASTKRIDKSELRPGDLVFFNTLRRAYSHVGIYIGDNKFIHAPRTGARVRVENMDLKYWRTRFNGARRVSLTDGMQQPRLRSAFANAKAPSPESNSSTSSYDIAAFNAGINTVSATSGDGALLSNDLSASVSELNRQNRDGELSGSRLSHVPTHPDSVHPATDSPSANSSQTHDLKHAKESGRQAKAEIGHPLAESLTPASSQPAKDSKRASATQTSSSKKAVNQGRSVKRQKTATSAPRNSKLKKS